MGTEHIIVRAASEDEAPLILEFIRQKAAFDAGMKCDATLHTSEAAIRETLFGATPFARVLFAELSGTVAAFALYYFRYSSFQGRPHLWLDDLFVSDQVRSHGVGAALMRRLAQIAVDHQCTHMAWTASVNNARGIQFYKRLGAEVSEQRGSTLFFQAAAPAMHSLARPI
ncbi:MAG: GNAT family N-acetyltransferase [Abitibacteriaceae bacterium]|nr:GNAT family N-acetyltransferase [Abditibacteriaceae bacterium]